MIGLIVIGLLLSVVGAVPVREVDIDAMRRDFEEARGKAGLTKDQIARIQGISIQQLDNHLDGRGHLSVARLYAMFGDEDGRRFLSAWIAVVSKRAGLDFDRAKAVCEMFFEAMSEKRKMAKAELWTGEERRRA